MKEDAERIVKELFSLGDEEAKEVLHNVGVEVGGEEEPEQKAEGEAETEETEEFVLEPVIKKEENAEPAEKVEEPAIDPVLDILMKMKPDERAAWAAKEGQEAVLKLMQLQQIELEQKIQQKMVEQKKMALDGVIEEWAENNQELLSDPLLEGLAEGLDMRLLKQAGYSSYLELTPRELKEHLRQVSTILGKIKEAGISSEIFKKEKGGAKAKEEREEKPQKAEAPFHIGDFEAGGEPGTGFSPESLETLVSDPLKFESAVSKIDDAKLAEYLGG